MNRSELIALKRDRIGNHINTLGFSSVEQYKQWCRDNNFSTKLIKSERELAKEKYYQQNKPKASVVGLSLQQTKNPGKFVSLILDNKISPDEICTPSLRDLYGTVQNLVFEQRSALKEIIDAIGSKIDIFDVVLHKKTFLKGLTEISKFKDWQRDPRKWNVPSHNIRKQFSSFVRYLLCQYEVPLFMDQVWFGDIRKYQHWFLHVGSGQNIRTASELPLPLTKKAAHHFLLSPDDCSIVEALQHGYVCGLGGDLRLSHALRGTQWDFSQLDFWTSVIRFFVANPMLDMAHLVPIWDYIKNQRFESQRIQVERGVWRTEPPPQPNFCMKGRTVETLLSQVEKWHKALGKQKKYTNCAWEKSKVRDISFGSKEKMKIWHFRELLSTEELMSEGRAMRHCAGSYANSCASGRCAIFSLEIEEDKQIRKLLTIEIQLASKVITQARGKFNTKPDAPSLNMLHKFAKETHLTIASYV